MCRESKCICYQTCIESKMNKNEKDKHIVHKTENQLQIVWRNVIIFVIMHSITFYGIYLIFSFNIKLATLIFNSIYLMIVNLGVTGGAHRLWTHRTYTANVRLRIFLMLAQSAALQNHIYEWARDHRMHHKYTDTNADPHNSTRGFFFCHMGWLMCKKHPDVIKKGKTLDMGDVLADPVVRFQMRYYIPLVLLLNQILPTMVPWYFWNESLWISFVVSMTRYVVSLNGTWCVNSAAHIWGGKPYDKNIKPTENGFVITIAMGEGFHNFHHVFPWDYKAAELGNYRYNLTTAFLDFMGKIGWATDLKTTPEHMIRNRANRTGDGSWTPSETKDTNDSYKKSINDDRAKEKLVWGWGDTDMDTDEIKQITKSNRLRG